jgi:hypothetical protein
LWGTLGENGAEAARVASRGRFEKSIDCNYKHLQMNYAADVGPKLNFITKETRFLYHSKCFWEALNPTTLL